MHCVRTQAKKLNFHNGYHRLQTPNEKINQKYRKKWAAVADNLCFGRT